MNRNWFDILIDLTKEDKIVWHLTEKGSYRTIVDGYKITWDRYSLHGIDISYETFPANKTGKLPFDEGDKLKNLKKVIEGNLEKQREGFVNTLRKLDV